MGEIKYMKNLLIDQRFISQSITAPDKIWKELNLSCPFTPKYWLNWNPEPCFRLNQNEPKLHLKCTHSRPNNPRQSNAQVLHTTTHYVNVIQVPLALSFIYNMQMLTAAATHLATSHQLSKRHYTAFCQKPDDHQQHKAVYMHPLMRCKMIILHVTRKAGSSSHGSVTVMSSTAWSEVWCTHKPTEHPKHWHVGLRVGLTLMYYGALYIEWTNAPFCFIA